MSDKTVRDAVMDTVLNQIDTGDPPEARTTYDRLIDAGASNSQALHLMAQVLRVEMNEMLTKSTPFDNARYAAGLAKLKAPTTEGVALRERLYEALELKNTEFNAHGIELNQRYISTAVRPDPTVGDEEWPRHPELYLQATTRPGAKLPHAWLVGTDGRRTSTLDVTGKGQMTLLTGLAGAAWKDAADKLELPFLKTVVIGQPGAADPYGHWQQIREIPEAGALLVRPDGYIAWRHNADVRDIDEAATLLQDALCAVLDRPNRPEDTTDGAGDRQQYSTRSVDITVPAHSPATGTGS